MDNAIRYTGSGSEINLTLTKHLFGACVEISGTGIGIPTEDLQKITERFYRVDKARSRSKGGTGLGLTIAEKLMTLHNGRIEIVSVYGKGTSVKLLFKRT